MQVVLKAFTIIVYILILTQQDVLSQSTPSSSIIEKYTNKDFYGASKSNFQITQDLYGNISSGHFDNVLKFNGDRWSSLESSNIVITSIYYSHGNKLIFYGSKVEFV